MHKLKLHVSTKVSLKPKCRIRIQMHYNHVLLGFMQNALMASQTQCGTHSEDWVCQILQLHSMFRTYGQSQSSASAPLASSGQQRTAPPNENMWHEVDMNKLTVHWHTLSGRALKRHAESYLSSLHAAVLLTAQRKPHIWVASLVLWHWYYIEVYTEMFVGGKLSWISQQTAIYFARVSFLWFRMLWTYIA